MHRNPGCPVLARNVFGEDDDDCDDDDYDDSDDGDAADNAAGVWRPLVAVIVHVIVHLAVSLSYRSVVACITIRIAGWYGNDNDAGASFAVLIADVQYVFYCVF